MGSALVGPQRSAYGLSAQPDRANDMNELVDPQAIEPPPTASRRRRSAAEVGEEPAPISQAGAGLFAQVVWAHHRWERDRSEHGEPDRALEAAYLRKLAEFERSEGRLEHVYWSTRSASAVGMSIKARPRKHGSGLRLREADDVVQLHRLSDWVTRDSARIADLLQECDLLAIRVGEVLRGTSERIAMRWILGIEQHLLAFFERTSELPNEKAERELAEAQCRKLAEIESYYHRAASKAGRIVYVSGMLIGVCLVAAVGIVAGLALWATGLSPRELQIVLLCYGAGAMGALISAMSRMGSAERGFQIDFELGRPLMRRLGVYRPFVGAIVGVAVYFLLASGILNVTIDRSNDVYYYGFVAFLSGFSERLATVVFGAAERRLGVPRDDGVPMTASPL